MIIHNGTLHQGDIPLNRSFRYGDGLFETIRVYEGHLLFWKDHMERLEKGMKQLKFEFRPQLFQLLLQENARLLLKELAINKHGRLRIHVYRSGRGAYSPINRDPSFVIEAYSFDADTYESLHPVSMVSFKDYPLTIGPATGIKSANSLPYIMAAMHAQDKGVDESLLFNQEGAVSEASSSNIFYIKEKKLFTPDLSSLCLPGIMRKQIIQLAHELKIPITEKRIKESELAKAEAIFLTNSIRGLIPVNEWGKHSWNSHSHPMVKFLKNCLVQYVLTLP